MNTIGLEITDTANTISRLELIYCSYTTADHFAIREIPSLIKFISPVTINTNGLKPLNVRKSVRRGYIRVYPDFSVSIIRVSDVQ